MAGTVRFAVNDPDFRLLRRRLDRLAPSVRNKVARPTLVKMATPLKRAMRANILGKTGTRTRGSTRTPGDKPGSVTGNLKRSIGHRVRRYGGFFLIVVGPTWPQGAHGHLVEYGHRISRTKLATGFLAGIRNRGKVLGQVPPHPFAWPAFNQTRGQVETIRNSELGRRIELEAARAA